MAQLGKNFEGGYNNLITGNELLKIACDSVREIQRIVGGKYVYLECEDNPRLTDFNESNRFVSFGTRYLVVDELGQFKRIYFILMLKYF